MSTSKLLATLATLDVRLWVDGDQLRVDAPKGALTPALLQALKAAKVELVAHLAAEEAAPVSVAHLIPSIDRKQPLQLSSAQQRLWVLEQLNPGTSLYNITEAVRLRGPLDRALLPESIRQVIARHETLRTSFVRNEDGSAKVVVQDAVGNVAVDFRLLSNASLGIVENMLRQWLDEEAQSAFDLAAAPLLRCVLAEIDADDHVLIVTMHHMIADALSFSVFMHEVSEIYVALQRGDSDSLQALPVQYVDFAAWQGRMWQSDSFASQRTFWEEKLSGEVQPLQLPTDLASHSIGYQANRTSLNLSAELGKQLRTLARQERVTLFVLLLTAFKTLLNRYGGQEDLLVCAPVSGRNRVELENLIGYFNNILVLRSDLSGDPSFRELLRRVRSTVLEASERQEFPFTEIVNLPALRRVPLNRALFELREVKEHALHLPGVTVSPLVVEKGSSDFDLFFILYERAGELSCVLHSKCELFSEEAIARLLENFQRLLDEIVANPGLKLSEMPTFASGKVQEAGEKRQVAESKDSDAALVVQLTQIWQQVLGLPSLQPTDNFFELGGHSLLAVQLMAEIERRLTGEKLPLAMVLQAPTIAQMAAMLTREGWRSSWSSLVPIQPRGTQRPFFFVHAHGGNVLGYYDLARHLGDDQPFYGLQAMGMESGEKVTRRLEEMAAHYVAEIRTLQQQGPYLLGGWCLGGDVAYEMAQQLQAAGEEVALLVMVHNPLPGYPQYLPGSRGWQKKLYRLLARMDREWCNFVEVESGKVTYLRSRIEEMGKRIQIKLENQLEPLMGQLGIEHSHAYKMELLADAHMKAYDDYHAKPYAGNVLLIRAQKQPMGTGKDSALGWDKLITGKLTLCEIPGYHIGLLSEPRVKQVAVALTNAFAQLSPR